jgi:hypothetical protein
MSMQAPSGHWLRDLGVWQWAIAGVRSRLAAPAIRTEDAPARTGGLPTGRAGAELRAAMEGLGARWRALSLATRAALTLLSIATVYRLALILHGWPTLDSDEAIIGLMARHILNAGERPVFFYGQDYMGAFQAYLAAALFAIFGSSTLILHLSVLLLTLGALAAMYALGKAAYGPAAGLLTLAWLTVGPALGVLRELEAIGGYQEMLLFAALVLLGVWIRLREPDPLPRTRAQWVRYMLIYAAIGLFGGLALWSDLLVVPVLIAAAAALAFGRTRELLHAGGVVLVLAFCLGAWPYLDYNFTHDNATYRQIVRQSRPEGHAYDLPTLGEWRDQTGATLAVALPALLGSPHVCVQRGDIWSGYPPLAAERTATPSAVCDGANTALSLGVITLYLLVAWQLVQALWLWAHGLPELGRRWQDRLAVLIASWQLSESQGARRWLALSRRIVAGSSGVTRSAEPKAARAARAEARARLWLRAMLLAIAAMTLVGYASSVDAQRFQFTSSRYLLPLYLTAPVLFGLLWSFARPLAMTLFELVRVWGGWGFSLLPHALPSGARTRTAWLATAALAMLFAFSLFGGTLTLARAGTSSQFALPVSATDTQLETFFDSHHITTFYADYWTCYRLAFESGERFICAVRGQDGATGLELINNRYDPYVRVLAASSHPAYILPADTAEDRGFAAEASAQHLPHAGYIRIRIDDYAIYYYPAKDGRGGMLY